MKIKSFYPSTDNQSHFKSFLNYVLVYAPTFVIIFYYIFSDFLFNQQNSFIWHIDGAMQHFPFLYDLSQIAKEFLNYPMEGFTNWSWHLGIGADVIQSYSYYLLGDPLSVLAALFTPIEHMELAYNLLIVIRFFLIGLFFLVYCKYMQLDIIPSITGSIFYTFSPFMIYWGIRHPFFINAAMILPLLFISIEKIFNGKKPIMFALIIAYGAINNFYFFYMNSIAAFIYASVRFFRFHHINRIKNFIALFIKTFKYYVLGLIISSFLFIPSIYAFLNTCRVTSHRKALPLFSFPSFLSFLKRFLTNHWGTWKIIVLLLAIMLLCLVYIYYKKNNIYCSYKALFVIYTFFTFVPYIYSIFSGFSAPTSRWIYLYMFIVAFMIALALQQDNKIREMDYYIIHLVLIVYSIVLLPRNMEQLAGSPLIIPIFIGFIILLILAICIHVFKLTDDAKRIYLYSVTLLLVSVFIIGNARLLLSEERYGSEFIKYGTIVDQYTTNITSEVNNSIQDNSFYRVGYKESAYGTFNHNESVINNIPSTTLYNSMTNGNIMELYKNNNIGTTFTEAGYQGVDNITALESILGVKYYILRDEEYPYLPYGFNKILSDNKMSVYQNQNPLPLGFVYYTFALAKDMSNYKDVDKIQAYLSQAFVETPIPGMNTSPIEKISEPMDYNIYDYNNVTMDNNRIEVLEKNGEVLLQVEPTKNTEIYIEFINVRNVKEKSSMIKVSYDGIKKQESTRSLSSQYYIGNHDYLINLGYKSQHSDTIKIIFPNKGTYTIDKINIYKVSMNDFDDKITKLNKTPLENIQLDNDRIEGDITLKESGLLFLSIPYSKGWRTTVDGNIVETIRVNTAFTGIPLGKGSHKIVLDYTTPFLYPSLVLSLIGVLILVVLKRKS